MTIRLHAQARQEIRQATGHYMKENTESAIQFRNDVNLAISLANVEPQELTQISPGIRRIVVNRFPYSVIYHYYEEFGELFIIAVAHQRRRPGCWKDRWPEEL